MTDRALPNMLPSTDPGLFRQTLLQSVGIDEPPPSQLYPGRATTFEALVPFEGSHFFSLGVHKRLLVVFTDGEASAVSPVLRYTIDGHLAPIFVHVWAPGERIFHHGRPDPRYRADPRSTRLLDQIAQLSGGRVFTERQESQIARAARDDVGSKGPRASVDAYARVALAPWFVLGGVVPLVFLLYRRNL